MRVLTIAVCLLLSSVFILGDEHSINFDEKIDFSKIKTFSVREGKSKNDRPELNNTLFLKRFGETIRGELQAKGLREVPDQPDIYVDYRIGGSEINTVERSPGIRVRGQVLAGTGPQSIRYPQGTLFIDLTARESNLLIWLAHYRDDEDNATRLSQRLPQDAKKLLSEYPPRKK
jgi:hypothetical protein